MPLFEKNLPSTIKSRAHINVFKGSIEDALAFYRRIDRNVYIPSLGMGWRDACKADIDLYISCVKDRNIKERFISVKQKLESAWG